MQDSLSMPGSQVRTASMVSHRQLSSLVSMLSHRQLSSLASIVSHRLLSSLASMVSHRLLSSLVSMLSHRLPSRQAGTVRHKTPVHSLMAILTGRGQALTARSNSLSSIRGSLRADGSSHHDSLRCRTHRGSRAQLSTSLSSLRDQTVSALIHRDSILRDSISLSGHVMPLTEPSPMDRGTDRATLVSSLHSRCHTVQALSTTSAPTADCSSCLGS